MGQETYDVGDILDKTLYAAKTLPVFDYPDTARVPIAYVAKGDPVGVVVSWTGLTNTNSKLWWQFWDQNIQKNYYALHKVGDFSVSELKAQGVLSTLEKAKKKEEENKPWYEKLLSKYVPYVVFAYVAAKAAQGYFSRPSNNKPS